MFSELPQEALMGFFCIGGVCAVRLAFLLLGSMPFAVAVFFMQGLGFLPGVPLAGNGAEEESGGGGCEDRGQFHPAAGCSESPVDGKWQGREVAQPCGVDGKMAPRGRG